MNTKINSSLPLSGTNFQPGNVAPKAKRNISYALFNERGWKIKNVNTEPPVLDIDGDGKAESELFSVLQEADQLKRFIFCPDGKVFEKVPASRRTQSAFILRDCGTWEQTPEDYCITWTLPDSKQFTARVMMFPVSEVNFIHKAEGLQLTYTLTAG